MRVQLLRRRTACTPKQLSLSVTLEATLSAPTIGASLCRTSSVTLKAREGLEPTAIILGPPPKPLLDRWFASITQHLTKDQLKAQAARRRLKNTSHKHGLRRSRPNIVQARRNRTRASYHNRSEQSCSRPRRWPFWNTGLPWFPGRISRRGRSNPTKTVAANSRRPRRPPPRPPPKPLPSHSWQLPINLPQTQSPIDFIGVFVQIDAFRKLALFLEPQDVLRGVRHQAPQLASRYDSREVVSHGSVSSL